MFDGTSQLDLEIDDCMVVTLDVEVPTLMQSSR